MKKTHGGARLNAGRKTEVQDQKTERVNVTLDPLTVRKLRVVGEGNLSRGIRKSAELAYEKYQSE